jgi:hypothetical protein
MILSRSAFWFQMKVLTLDLFPPALVTSTRTGRGQITRARSFGDDLWTGTVTLAKGDHDDMRARRALLALVQQPGVQVVINEPTYEGPDITGVTLQAVSADNRGLTLSGPAAARLKVGDCLEVTQGAARHFHTVTRIPPTAGMVEVMPHARIDIPIGAAVVLRDPAFLAVVDAIRPAMFEPIVTGEASFTVTQVFP